MRLLQLGLLIVAVSLVSGCVAKNLRHLPKPGEGPDEFKVVPSKPLEAPSSYSELPAPTPGGANLTDQDPLQDSAAALGGRRTQGGSADGGIVNHASRFGRDANIRPTLAAADEEFRRRRGRFSQIRIAKTDRYKSIYRNEALDPNVELKRWRKAGARTPSAPTQ